MDHSALIKLIDVLRENSISFYKDKDLELHIDLADARKQKGGEPPYLLDPKTQILDKQTGEIASAIPQTPVLTEEEMLFYSVGFDESEIRPEPPARV